MAPSSSSSSSRVRDFHFPTKVAVVDLFFLGHFVAAWMEEVLACFMLIASLAVFLETLSVPFPLAEEIFFDQRPW